MDDASFPSQVMLRIGHEDVVEASGGSFDHLHPVTGAVSIPLAGPAEMDRAVQAAVDAFEGWAR